MFILILWSCSNELISKNSFSTLRVCWLWSISFAKVLLQCTFSYYTCDSNGEAKLKIPKVNTSRKTVDDIKSCRISQLMITLQKCYMKNQIMKYSDLPLLYSTKCRPWCAETRMEILFRWETTETCWGNALISRWKVNCFYDFVRWNWSCHTGHNSGGSKPRNKWWVEGALKNTWPWGGFNGASALVQN